MPWDELVRAIHALTEVVDFGPRLAAFVAAAAASLGEAWTRFIVSTVNANDGRDFTSDPVIAAYAPVARDLADAALVPIATWAFYRVMFGHGMFTQYTARILLPRVVVAVAAVNFALPVFQAAVDLDNQLCEVVVGGFGSHVHFIDLVRGWAADALPGPGLGPFVTLALLIGFVLLAIVYVIRYALLVMLAILAPVAAVLMVLPETQHHARTWMSLFFATLFMQPLQLFILAVALVMEAEDRSVIRHGFALAALWMCFKVPGALHTASTVGGHAQTIAKHHLERLAKVAAKA